MSRYIPVCLGHRIVGIVTPAVGCACPWKPKFGVSTKVPKKVHENVAFFNVMSA
jgi:hypothetical protein